MSGGQSVTSPVEVLSVIRSERLTVRFLGPYTGILEHWKGKPSKACRGAGKCPTALHSNPIGVKTVWKGFAPVEAWHEKQRLWVPGVLEITESLEHLLANTNLRGLVWSLYFLTNEKGRKKVEGVTVPCVETAPLRDAFDVRPVVRHCYHEPETLFDVPNPMPPRLTLTSMPGQGPDLPQLPDVRAAQQPTEAELNLRRQKLAEIRAMASGGKSRRFEQGNGARKEASNGHS